MVPHHVKWPSGDDPGVDRRLLADVQPAVGVPNDHVLELGLARGQEPPEEATVTRRGGNNPHVDAQRAKDVENRNLGTAIDAHRPAGIDRGRQPGIADRALRVDLAGAPEGHADQIQSDRPSLQFYPTISSIQGSPKRRSGNQEGER